MNENQQQPDLGHAVHYAAVTKGTPVYDAEGVEVGRVHQIVDNYREHILDGIVIEDSGGDVRFVDGPEVTRTYEGGVLLSITAAQVAELHPPENGPGVFGPSRAVGRIGRLFSGGWKRK